MSKKKKKKKKYSSTRTAVMACIDHQTDWKHCPCLAIGDGKHRWILVNGKELEHYKETGLIPDVAAELAAYEGGPVPQPIPPEFPPCYGFNV